MRNDEQTNDYLSLRSTSTNDNARCWLVARCWPSLALWLRLLASGSSELRDSLPASELCASQIGRTDGGKTASLGHSVDVAQDSHCISRLASRVLHLAPCTLHRAPCANRIKSLRALELRALEWPLDLCERASFETHTKQIRNRPSSKPESASDLRGLIQSVGRPGEFFGLNLRRALRANRA